MNDEAFNRFCKKLPATTYVVQWGGSHVWKVGGKVFAIGGCGAFTFKTTREDYDALIQVEGVRPAPYLASRGMSWVQDEKAPGLGEAALKEHLRLSHQIVASGLSKKRQRELGLIDRPESR